MESSPQQLAGKSGPIDTIEGPSVTAIIALIAKPAPTCLIPRAPGGRRPRRP
jgi:hypothetical protein